MTVEITPQGNAARIAKELLAIAEADPRFRIDDVKTTTAGPLGFAFIIPDELHEAWDSANLTEAPVTAEPRRGRGRPRATETTKE